jgi:hypothetical protein
MPSRIHLDQSRYLLYQLDPFEEENLELTMSFDFNTEIGGLVIEVVVVVHV